MSDAPILPCVILGTDRLYARRSYRPFRPVGVWIGFGELLRPDGEGKGARQELEVRIGETLRNVCREMVTSFQLADDDLPQPPNRRMGRTP